MKSSFYLNDKMNFLESQLRAFKSCKRIVVIESDDWGSERVPDSDVRRELILRGLDMSSNPHSIYDTLERMDDLIAIKELFEWVWEQYGKKVKLTANFVTANPAFEKIKSAGLSSYYFESFTETYYRRDNDLGVINYLKCLIEEGYFIPQFHGREHINVQFWLDELRSKNDNFLSAFDLGVYAIDVPTKRGTKNLMAALDFETRDQLEFVKDSIRSGHSIFREVFGFSSQTFVAPRYVWSEELNDTLVAQEIQSIQSGLYQAVTDSDRRKRIQHYTGQKSRTHPLYYSVRNVMFEPAYPGLDWLNTALKRVKTAFMFRTPAVISMHRVNFVGGLNRQRRDENLDSLKRLLINVIEAYPDVEFFGSNELCSEYIRS